MSKQNPIPSNILESITKVIADTEKGLTGSEIGKFLPEYGMTDVDPSMTKWKRLFNAFADYQNRSKQSNMILLFIQKTIHPTRYLKHPALFQEILFDLNKVLSFIGFELKDTGKYVKINQSKTISDAESRANRLLDKLNSRGTHPDVLTYCKAELLVDNYFHAVFEATKSIADKIRTKTGLKEDGSKLVDLVFSIKNPLLKVNSLSTETEESEHKGFANLLRGLFGMFRNTTAHAPKIKWEIKESDALDIFGLVSLLHRRIDSSTKV